MGPRLSGAGLAFSLLFVSAGAAAVEPSEVLSYEAGAAVPPGYRVKTTRAAGLLIAGGVTFFAGYGASYGVGAVVTARLHLDGRSIDTIDYYPLYIPFAGPFIGLATTEPTAGEATGLVASGAAQIAGGALLLVGLLREEKTLVRVGGVALIAAPSGLAGTF